ncbi:unnamed protein product [Phytophthora fragariaefolia]|uniref:Unnamed protein product n=1 Tax=Phytophthora fragariaefolia TaxID=1490495 RepID=A0A9W6XMT1_9STRA|nr:unnamed protein product [Phytophthora fragariaefolia]
MDRAEPNIPQQSTAPQEAAPPVLDVSDATQAHDFGSDRSPAFIPLLEGTPGSTLPDPLPQVGIGAAPLDEGAIRTSLAAVGSALRRASEFQDPQRSYDRLLSSYFRLRRHVVELQHDLDDAARLAPPFVQFVQHKFSVQANKLQRSQEGTIWCTTNAMTSFEQTIDDLNRRLAVALAAATANALGASGTDPQLQARLDAAIANQAATARDLNEAQESIKALEASRTALETSNRNFRQQITNLRSRIGQTEAEASAVLTGVLDERDRLQALLDKSDQEVQDHLTALRQAREDCDRTLTDIVQARKYHSSIATVFPLILHCDFRRSGDVVAIRDRASGEAFATVLPALVAIALRWFSTPAWTTIRAAISAKPDSNEAWCFVQEAPSPTFFFSISLAVITSIPEAATSVATVNWFGWEHIAKGTQTTPIHVDTSDSSGASPSSASRGGLGQGGAQADRDSTSGGGRSSADASAGCRSSGNDGDNGSAGPGRSDSFLSDQDLRQLAPTNIPRER